MGALQLHMGNKYLFTIGFLNGYTSHELKLNREQIKTVLNLSKYPIYYMMDNHNVTAKKLIKESTLKNTLKNMSKRGVDSLGVGWFGFKVYNEDGNLIEENNHYIKHNLDKMDFETFLAYIRLSKTPSGRAELNTYIATITPTKHLHQIVKNRLIKPTFEHASDMQYMYDKNGKTRAYILGSELIE